MLLSNNNNNNNNCWKPDRPSHAVPLQNDMLFCDALSSTSTSTQQQQDQHIYDLPVRLDDSSPSSSPPPPSCLQPRSLSLGRSLGGSSPYDSDDDEPLPIATVQVAKPELRTWRITSAGLVSTMGAFLDKPKTAKENDSGAGQGLKWAMSTMQGWRVDMEDAHVAQVSMGDALPFSRWSFFAVFDGHAGSQAAELAAEIVMETLMESEQLQQAAAMAAGRDGALCKASCELLERGLKEGFLALDEKIRRKLELSKDRSGTTAVCSIVTPSHIVLANLGDSRAVLSRPDTDTFGTEDHKPSNVGERERIVNAGGSVMIQRINGSLAVSRALGDFEYKSNSSLSPARQQVSPEPDVYFFKRQASDEYLIVACDGIYDVMLNHELCAFVHARLEVAKDGGLQKVCNEVLDACLSKGSRDNMTMLLVCFEGAPSVREDVAAAEEQANAVIKAALAEIIAESLHNGDKDDDLTAEYLLRTLQHTRPEAWPKEGSHTKLLLRSIADAAIADSKTARNPEPEPADSASPAPASPGIPAQ